MKRGRSPKISERKMSERAIIEALEEGPARWQEVYERVDMAKSTFNDSLKELEDKEEVERYYDKDRKATLIRLSDKLTDPIERTLRHLDNLTVRPLLDLEKARELLDDDSFVENILDIATFEYRDREFLSYEDKFEEYLERAASEIGDEREISPENMKLEMPPPDERELNEYFLIEAVTRILTEKLLLLEEKEGVRGYDFPPTLSRIEGFEKKYNKLISLLKPMLTHRKKYNPVPPPVPSESWPRTTIPISQSMCIIPFISRTISVRYIENTIRPFIQDKNLSEILPWDKGT